MLFLHVPARRVLGLPYTGETHRKSVGAILKTRCIATVLLLCSIVKRMNLRTFPNASDVHSRLPCVLLHFNGSPFTSYACEIHKKGAAVPCVLAGANARAFFLMHEEFIFLYI